MLLYPSIIDAQQYGCLTSTSGNQAPPEALPCTSIEPFIPSANDLIKTIRISFTVLQRELPFSESNFTSNNITYLEAIYDRLNSLYGESNAPWCEGAFGAFLYPQDTRIRFQLEDPIRFIPSEQGWTNGDGSSGSSFVFEEFASCEDEILNIFFCESPTSVNGIANSFEGKPYIVLYDLYDDYNQNGPNAWGHGNLLGHEIGHHLGLQHSFSSYVQYSDMCQDPFQSQAYCSPGSDAHCTNNMMAYSAFQDFISPLQMARMQHTLSRNDKVNKFVIHNFNSNQNITIDVPTIWDESRFLWGDVIINPGAELTISCKITMPPAGRIIVKRGARLIIDGQQWLNPPYPTLGGWVTSSGPTHYNCGEGPVFDRWTGIEVWGNPSITSTPEMLDEDYDLQTDDPGVVIIKNAGIVERAERGIFGQMRGNSWPTQQQHFGGLISVNNGEFRDCRKAIEYYSSSPLSIPSTFINCRIAQIYLGSTVANDLYTFEGVTSWQVSGLSFDDNCRFENLDNGIVLGNADATIQKSEFLLCYAGIRAFMTNNLFNKSIKIGGTPEDGNLFKYCKYGVWSLATGRVRVEYNKFEDCTDGIIMENTSWHVIHGNSFTNKGGDPTATLNTGVAGINNGKFQNFITCNTFSKQGNNPLVRVGVYLGGSNTATFFDGNSFICQEDVKVIDHNGNNGSLPDQNWQLNTYNFNLFTPFSTSGHVSEIATPNPSLNKTELFTYYPPTKNCNSNFLPRWPILGTCEDINVWSYQFKNEGYEIITDVCSSPPPRTALRHFNCSSLDMCLDSFNIRLNGLSQYLLPGASPELISLIQNAPTSTGTITSLISASPYLSEDILSLVANSNMNEEDKLAISALNMPISPFIRSALEGSISEPGLSDIDSLISIPKTNPRDSLIQKEKLWESSKLTWLHNAIDSLVEINDYANIVTLLQQDTSRTSLEWIGALYEQSQDWSSLTQLLQNYPNSHSADIEYKDVHSIGMAYQSQEPSGSINQADSLRLMEIATGSSLQGGYAKSLLYLIYGISMEPELNTEENLVTPKEPILRNVAASNSLHPDIRILPNPSNGSIQFLTKSDHSKHIWEHICPK